MSDLPPTFQSRDARPLPPPPAVLLANADGRITHANHAAAELWDTAASQLVGRNAGGLLSIDRGDAVDGDNEGEWQEIVGDVDQRRVFRLRAVSPSAPEGGAGRAARAQVERLSDTIFLLTIEPIDAPAISSGLETSGLAELQQHGGAGFFELDLKSGYATYSASWKQILGYADAELPPSIEVWRGLIHPDDTAAAPDRPIARAEPGARPFDVEFRMRHRTGRWVWLHSVGRQILAADGSVERVVGVHLDVSDRKESEEISLTGDERLRLLSDTGPLGAFDLDFTQQAFWFSPGWKRTLGYAEDDRSAEANSFEAALPADEKAAGVEAWIRLRLPGLNSFVSAEVLTGKDGQPTPVLLGIHRTLTRKRQLARVVGYITRAPGQSGLILPAPLVQSSLEALSEGVLLTDAAGQLIHLNPAASRLLGVAWDDVRHEPVSQVFRLIQRENDEPYEDPFARAISATEPLTLQTDAALPARQGLPALPIVWTARVSRDPNGRLQGVALVFRNPAEVSLTPEEMLKANRAESLAAVSGGIAHDFNELLTTILGGISLAKDKRDSSALNESEQACIAAKSLTKQLLAFVAGGTGAHAIISPIELLSAPVKLAGAGSDAAITIEVADGTDGVRVDRSQMAQVFQNLILNALQAMPAPPHRARVHLRASSVRLTEDQIPPLPAGPYVEIEVRDNGSGIAPENLQKIFDPFFTTRKHRTGLGLATALSIVRKHQGQLGVVSTLGEGTAFTVFLPAVEAPAAPEAQKAPSVRFRTGRILLMDDDPRVTGLTAPMLESLDYRCDVARDGTEAVQFYQRYFNIGRPYDAVILDVTVTGGMGGEECFRALREVDPEVRAIISTPYENNAMARRFMDQGFCGYLTKPYRTADLGQVLKAVLG